MYQLKDKIIEYDGYDLSKIGWYNVGKPSDDLSYNVGLPTKVKTVSGINYDIITGIEYELPTFQITFCKMTKNNIATIITENDKNELTRILYKDTPSILKCGSREYVGIFENLGEAWRNSAKKGYITFTYKMSCPYALSNPLIHEFNVKESCTNKINNESTIRYEKVYPAIKFNLGEDTTDIEIINHTNGTYAKFTGLTPKHYYTLYCDTRQCIDEVDPTFNCFSHMDGGRIVIEYAPNTIEIIAKSAYVEFMHHDKMAIDEV